MRDRRRWDAVMVLVGALLLTAAPAHAADVVDANSAGDKLVRGLANTFLGFLEIPRNIHNTTQAENSLLEGWTIGLGKGLGQAVLRTGVGLYEIVTFPFPIPEGYRPIVEPEFVWDAGGPKVVD
jgi:putative exosortase-associated protein (TIGR04073 family)